MNNRYHVMECKENEDIKIMARSPIETWTYSSVAVLWDKPEVDKKISEYEVYVDGSLQVCCETSSYTLENLQPQQIYSIQIRARLEEDIVIFSDEIVVTTKKMPKINNILDFGAVQGGEVLNTQMVQRAIDLCGEGDCVYVPEGIFLTGAIYLKSNMTLFIEKGGKLLGSENLVDYPLMKYRFEGLETECYASLINTREAKRHANITIMGEGTIDASGSSLRKKELKEEAGKPGRAVCIRNTVGVYLKDITIRQSPAWCLHTIYCKNVSLNHVQIHTKYDEAGEQYQGISNGDGFDPDSTSNVNVFQCMIASQDDCIAIKSGRDAEGRSVGIPSEHIWIADCEFNSGFGVALGSEMSGDVRDVSITDCIFKEVYSLVTIKAPRGRGGIIEEVKVKSIKHTNYSLEHEDCKWFRGAINIDQFYGHEKFDDTNCKAISEQTAIIRNIYMEDISMETIAGNAIYIMGLPESPIRNIYLKNIVAKGKHGSVIRNVQNLNLDNVRIHTNME